MRMADAGWVYSKLVIIVMLKIITVIIVILVILVVLVTIVMVIIVDGGRGLGRICRGVI